MSRPLLRTSSKVPTTAVLPGAGQAHAISSPAGMGGCEASGPGAAAGTVPRGALAEAVGDEAAASGAEAADTGVDAAPTGAEAALAGWAATGAAATVDDATGRTIADSGGGVTRITCPTSS